MVEIEIAAKAVKTTVNEAEHIAREATAENNQDVSEQVARDAERSLKQVTNMAILAGSRGISKVSSAVSEWGSDSASKTNDVTEDIDI